MKKVGIISMMLICIMLIVDCTTTSQGNSQTNLTRTSWVLTFGDDSISYTFTGSKYTVTSTNLEIQRAMTLGKLTGRSPETGTYSVSNNTITFVPEGRSYICIAESGDVSVQLNVESFTATLEKDHFVLDGYIYKKR